MFNKERLIKYNLKKIKELFANSKILKNYINIDLAIKKNDYKVFYSSLPILSLEDAYNLSL